MICVKAFMNVCGDVRIVALNNVYNVIFNTYIHPGQVYHKEFHNLTFKQALAKYYAIEQIYMKDSQQMCGFFASSKVKCVCHESNCQYLVVSPNFWRIHSYDCIYRGR